jgi:hypothetical protein
MTGATSMIGVADRIPRVIVVGAKCTLRKHRTNQAFRGPLAHFSPRDRFIELPLPLDSRHWRARIVTLLGLGGIWPEGRLLDSDAPVTRLH